MNDYDAEYAAYQKKLLSNGRFLESFNDKYYEVRRSLTDQKHGFGYHFWSGVLMIAGGFLGGLLIADFANPGEGIWYNIIRIILILGASACFYFSHYFSTQHDTATSHSVFNQYVRPEMLRKYVKRDASSSIINAQDKYSQLLDKAEGNALRLYTNKNLNSQERKELSEAVYFDILALVGEGERVKAVANKYDRISEDITTDYTLLVAINKRIDI